MITALLTSHAGRRYLGAGKNSVAEVGDIRLSRWGEETLNTNKADGFGLGGFYCTVLATSSEFSLSDLENPGRQ